MTTQEVLEAAGFTGIEECRVDVPYRWSLDDFVGYVFSRSVTSRAAFGVDAEPFEADLRERLLAHDVSGVYAETLRAYYVLGRLDA